jgi:DNA-binding beta-propeller fold protein YncE
VTDSRFQFLEIGGKLRRPTPAATEIAPPAAPRVSFRLAETIGAFGAELGEFSCPAGIALDQESNLYVADSCNHRLQKITPEGDVYGLGGPDLLLHPQGVAVDGSRFMYIIEQGANRLQKFGPEGQFIFALGGPAASQARFASPTAISLDAYHHIYIADTDNNRVTSYIATGLWFMDYVSPSKEIAFSRPQGVAVDLEGRIYISDTMNHRIIRLTAHGKLDRVIGEPGPEFGQLSEPCGLALDPDGGLWVADTGNDRIQKFTPDGEAVCCFPEDRTPDTELNSPRAIAVDSTGDIYISDTLNHRLLRLTSTGVVW